MIKENNTTAAQAAMLSEKELWAAFLPLTITMTVSASIFTAQDVDQFCPFDSISNCGAWGYLGDLANTVTDAVNDSEDPKEELENWIEDLEGYVNNLKSVHKHFNILRRIALVMPPEPAFGLEQANPEAYKAWEKAAYEAEENPRYYPPATTVGVEAA